jgi:hypothetical protein
MQKDLNRCRACEHIQLLRHEIFITLALYMSWRFERLVARGILLVYWTVSPCLGSGEPTMVPRLSCLLSRCAVSIVSRPLSSCSSRQHHSQRVTVISFYSSTIFMNVGYTATQALYASLGYGAIQVVATIPTLFLIDTKGRRTLTLAVSISL